MHQVAAWDSVLGFIIVADETYSIHMAGSMFMSNSMVKSLAKCRMGQSVLQLYFTARISLSLTLVVSCDFYYRE